MHNDTATEQTPGAYDPRNHGHSIHVVIVCGWGFTPNPTGRAYTAPSHHLVGCMGIAIHIPPPLSRPLPYVQCVLPKQRKQNSQNSQNIFCGGHSPFPDLRTRNMVTSHAVASKLPALSSHGFDACILQFRRAVVCCNAFTGVTAYDYDN